MREFFTSIRRTPYQSITSFFILFFTLLLSLFLFYVISFFHGILPFVESKVQVIAYFDTQTKENDILEIRDQLNKSEKVLSVKYVSKNEALKIYREFNKDNPLLLEMVSADILPASLEVYTTQPEFLGQVADELRKQPGIDEVRYEQSIVERLIALTNTLRSVSTFIFAFFMIISSLVLMTMTGFKIALKKDEIELQRLLGATTWYIRKPFLMEGVIFGALSGLFAFGFFYLGFFYFKSSLDAYLQGIPSLEFFGLSGFGLAVWPPTSNFIFLSLFVTIFFGILIGFIGNLFATSKYIK